MLGVIPGLLEAGNGSRSNSLGVHLRLKKWMRNGVPVTAARNAPPELRCPPPPITMKRNTNRHPINAAGFIFESTMTPPIHPTVDSYQLSHLAG
jgi:hypothetical protein